MVYLLKSAAEINQLKLDSKAKAYVADRLKDGQGEVIEINEYSHFLFFVAVPKGKKAEDMEDLRRKGARLTKRLNALKVKEVIATGLGVDESALLALAEGMALANYQFLKYFTKSEAKTNSLRKIAVGGVTAARVQELARLVESVCLSRDLINEPVITLGAEQLADAAVKMAKEVGIKAEVLNKKKIESLKMGGLLAVNYGSIDPPTFTILEYKPTKPINAKPIVLVGKGVVYDTGGLSLKPTAGSMDSMKCDMSGAAAVIGAIRAAALNQLNVHVVGLIPATDNRPGLRAYTPGDVITHMDGTTVEVLNTDAEGRLILADALVYAKKYSPELTFTVATLTGAASQAIGSKALVGMGNAPEKRLKGIQDAGFRTYERVALFPFWKEYKDQLKSSIADMKNIGGKEAGAITAGKFLEHFTDYPYIHLDIAGPAFIDSEDGYRTRGGTGVGVRLLYDFLKQYK
jgi:leucyl aminopeptidase